MRLVRASVTVDCFCGLRAVGVGRLLVARASCISVKMLLTDVASAPSIVRYVLKVVEGEPGFRQTKSVWVFKLMTLG